MLDERCVACGAQVPLSDAVHLLVNPKDDEDVVDGYLCRSCYASELEPLVSDEETDADTGNADAGAVEEDARADPGAE